MSAKNKLALGTVQFGTDYGISNHKGKVPFDEVKKILDFALSQGVNMLDTAYLYGNSEENLGRLNLEKFHVVTKTTKLDAFLDKDENIERYKQAFYLSLKRLGKIKLHGLLFHDADDLLSPLGSALWDLISSFKAQGYVRKIGVSVYSSSQLEQVLNTFDIDIVQLPLNIFDQRFLPILPYLKQKGIEIHCRSVFLQGLLFMDIDNVPEYFEPIKHILAKLPVNRLELALSFVKNVKEVDKAVVGVTLKDELEEIVLSYNKENEIVDFSKFKIDDEKFINPSKWRLVKNV